jgi:hypothetical protein
VKGGSDGFRRAARPSRPRPPAPAGEIAGADHTIRDPQHDAAPLDWATFGSDHVARPGGDYEGCARALLEAGARPGPHEPPPAHAAVREVLRAYAER